MQESELFEYAVVRIVPRVEREEFLNVGVVLYCRGQNFLDVRFALDTTRCEVFFAPLDRDELKAYLLAFQRICWGNADGGPIAALPMAERFRWLTAKRSTVVQTSPVHSGLCKDAGLALERLYEKLVL
ncbi:DUF3037 domain-containing protein [Parapedobacter tibetensis]|uniref:DUF3037 domain-containing protein n=1 Tax=Parapedobacter tibetensis TaxID=2972951 RepID=UPI00214DAC69|nr:DUF3037 domain-containing protein [Parapedobacter tibetensis]